MKTALELIEEKLNDSDGREFYRWIVINFPMLQKREELTRKSNERVLTYSDNPQRDRAQKMSKKVKTEEKNNS
jgi:hypothetical protein